ncbi:YdcF family protein [Allohahella marinimesophila]|uniref:YdcF family protein n=1 Tax=Allohahella marinimesophila TaxID=1054972 RepID=A0ABP7Q1N5_9GAMM
MIWNKLLPYLLYPTTWCLCLLLIIAVMAWRLDQTLLRNLAFAGFSLLWITASPWFSNWIWGSLENAHDIHAAEDIEEADAIVLLGGGVQLPKPPRVYADLNAAADRVLQAALLFKAGKAERILVSGGQVFPQPGLGSEADYQKMILLQLGVPDSAIILEPDSRNTAQNAEFTLPLARSLGYQRLILITSAYHMPRSNYLFEYYAEKLGSANWQPEIVPFPTDIRVTDQQGPVLLGFLPDAGSLAMTQEAIREYLGYWVYRFSYR